MAFAEAMETTLRKHDHKGGWDECTLNYLMNGVHRELKEADEEWDIKNFRGNYLRVSEELIDVANFCMMFWGNTQRYYNRKICNNHPFAETYEDAHLAGYQNGYEEGFEIGKAQCETHHEEMLYVEREKFKPLIDAMREFVDRCDRGEIRSVYTYAKFKELLAGVEKE